MASRRKTVAYYELVRASNRVRMQHADWPSQLDRLNREAPEKRTKADAEGVTIIGSILTEGSAKHLVIAAVTPTAERPLQIDLTSGDLKEVEIAVGAGLAEVCMVSFLPFGNVISYIRGSGHAPSIGVVTEWLNAVLPGPDLDAVPLLSTSIVEKLNRAHGADVIEVSTGSSSTLAAGQSGGTSSLLRNVAEQVGPVRARLRLSIGHRRGAEEQQGRMLEQARRMSTADDLARARARLIYWDGEKETREMVDFLKHHITAKADVDVDEGTVRTLSAVRGMLRVTGQLDKELRAAVDDSGVDVASA